MENDNSQTIVLVHFKGESDDETWHHDTRYFDRVPIVGECMVFERDGAWYETKLVLHMGFPLDYDAEIWATEVDPVDKKSNL